MLDVEIDEDRLLAVFKPSGALSAADFESAARIVDPVIEQAGALNGLIIQTPDFPGWESFAALVSHLRFVKSHHRRIKKLALVTDSSAARVAEALASHFVAAQIERFPYQGLEAAKDWIEDS